MLTLAIDAAAQQRFEALRRQWFPPERNQIPAHITLFHTLPESADIFNALNVAASEVPSFPLQVHEVRSLGRGVAFFMESIAAKALHRRLSVAFDAHLSAQDRHGFRPHVVVQNKVEPHQAKDALAILSAGFQPWQCTAVGMDLWRYMGGPWDHLRRFSFSAS